MSRSGPTAPVTLTVIDETGRKSEGECEQISSLRNGYLSFKFEVDIIAHNGPVFTYNLFGDLPSSWPLASGQFELDEIPSEWSKKSNSDGTVKVTGFIHDAKEKTAFRECVRECTIVCVIS
mmetsp:Transcript_16289/g.24554  ORF Transcript_16289/g.24554 Transcript_16289/m.24554 type:complete len:121 (-) Transcript_16289:82-444(-)